MDGRDAKGSNVPAPRKGGTFAAPQATAALPATKRSPIVADRGSSTQWFGAIRLGYTF